MKDLLIGTVLAVAFVVMVALLLDGIFKLRDAEASLRCHTAVLEQVLVKYDR